MNIQIKSFLLKLLGFLGIERWLYSISSYSQEGEDMILRRFVVPNGAGFYVDIGAHHPYRFSNTYYFHRQGWRGINIDPLPGAMELFNSCRPKDINLNLGVSENKGTLSYVMFNEPALNTFDKELAQERQSEAYKIIGSIDVPVMPLRELLDQHQDEFSVIDLMSVDVEGYDLEVLRSNDWSRFRPRLIVVESLHSNSISEVMQSEIYQYLLDRSYAIVGKSFYSCIYQDQKISS
jgi:FkbM family methyltransferase